MFKFYSKEYGRHNKKVVFFLGGWTMTHWQMWLTSRLLALNGYYCITYVYDLAILSPDVEKTRTNMLIVASDVKQRMSQLKKAGYDTFYFFGVSLGTLLSLMIANTSPDVSKIILITTGADLAEVIWSWDKVKPEFKAELIRKGISLPELKRRWKIVSPIHNADNLSGKKILLCLAGRDQLIPQEQVRLLVEKFHTKKYQCTVITTNYLNHAFAIAFNLLNAKKYLDFLKA